MGPLQIRKQLALTPVWVALAFAFFATFASAAFAGNFFATGHDQDFHCAADGVADECSYYNVVTNFVRGGSSLPILILDRDNSSDGAAGTTSDADIPLEAVAALNLAYSSDGSSTPTATSPPYVVEDPQGLQTTIINGTPPSGITTSSTWATTPLEDAAGHPLWSAIIVASDTTCGGCDLNNTDGTHVDSDDINARTSAIDGFFNAGGGLLYLAGANDAFEADGVTGKDVYYASVPVPLGAQQETEPFTVTPAGAALGITSDMANCCATHNSFTLPGSGSPLSVAETDSAGLAESVFIQNGQVCSAGFCNATPPPKPSPPTVPNTFPPAIQGSSGAGLSGLVNPEGLTTVAHFEVGLDPKYSGGGPVTYTQSTPTQNVGSDFVVHNVTASVSGLLPHALYHARLVASNADGTVDGPDQTFTTGKQAAPGAPTLGKTANVTPVSGLVFVKPPNGQKIHGVRAVTAAAGPAIPKGQGFIPLTQARQVPIGSQIDALRGTLNISLATGHARKTQAATLNGSVFDLGQNRSGHLKGLTTLSLKENAFKGAPSYATCSSKKTTRQPVSPLAQIAKLSSKVLQTLHASDRGGKFRTKGKYSAATVRGTDWFTEDRCDGTLTKVKRGSVDVQDFHTRKTIVLKAGHSFLAKRF